MLLIVHMQVDLAKRRREGTGSYPDGRGNGKQLATFLVWLIFAAPYQTNRK
jgi:hypothetical protein